MSRDKVGICVAGLGVGMRHALAYAEMDDDVDLFLCDMDAPKLDRARRELKIAGAFTNLESALRSNRVEAIDVSLPNSLHAPLAIQAAKHKKHCMVEKPLATSLKEADRMREESQTAGTLLAVAENFQFSPSTLRTVEMVRSGRIGKVFLASVTHEMWPVQFARSSWWFRRELAGGGVLLCAGVHAIRTLRMLVPSQISTVYAVATNSVLGIESEDTCIVTTEFDDGALGSIPVSWVTPRAHAMFEVHGSRGSIVSKRDALLLLSSPDDPGSEVLMEAESVNTIREECSAFVNSIKRGAVDDRISFEGGRKDLEVVEAAYLSVARKEKVELPL